MLPISERTFFVTGATDGVGKAMSFELARKGCRRALRPPRAAVV